MRQVNSAKRECFGVNWEKTVTKQADFYLTYDNLIFLINRIEMMDPDLMAKEPEETKLMINSFLNS